MLLGANLNIQCFSFFIVWVPRVLGGPRQGMIELGARDDRARDDRAGDDRADHSPLPLTDHSPLPLTD